MGIPTTFLGFAPGHAALKFVNSSVDRSAKVPCAHSVPAGLEELFAEASETMLYKDANVSTR